MWRFKPSKYKNAVPKTPQKREEWITDIAVGSLPSFGNHIKASAALVAFNVEHKGQGNLGVVSLKDLGRKYKSLPLLCAHSGFVTDFDFCPYDDYVLATASEDCHVKLWKILNDSAKCQAPSNPMIDVLLPHKVEAMKFHPQADCILSVAENSTIHLFDINVGQSIYSNSEHSSLVQSISWRYSGEVIGSCGQDKKLRIWDPRDSAKSQVVSNHFCDRDSKIVWLGNSDQLITTGLGRERQREVFLRDMRKLVEPLATYSGDTSLKAYIPLYDPDTNMLFLVAQADHAVIFCEVLDYAPFLHEAAKHISDIQILGGAMISKRALSLMDAEVNRLLLLGKDCVAPLSYQVPRKSYRNFHDDLFPDTFAPEPSLTSSQWQDGENSKVQKMRLNPDRLVLKSDHCFGSGSAKRVFDSSNNNSFITNSGRRNLDQIDQMSDEFLKPVIPKKPDLSAKAVCHSNNVGLEPTENLNDANESTKEVSKNTVAPNRRKAAPSFGIRVSKFRHLNGTLFPKEYQITDLASLTKTMPGESDCFDANEKRIAVGVGTGGNFLAILEFSKPGRAPAVADMPGILSGTSIMDFCWDPFDCNRLAVACDNGVLQIWIIPNDLSVKLEKPSFILKSHTEKITNIKFNPCAKDVIATASNDLTIGIWNLSSKEMRYRLSGIMDQILCMAWSPDGSHLASASKDQKVRIFNVRGSSKPIKEGQGPKGLRGARIVWVLNGAYLAVSGFSKISERQVYLYDCKDISNPLENISLDVSPATLVPYYDEDSSTLFLSGKGDAIIFAYEISPESPHFFPLSHYKCLNPHQALSFLPKCVCDVRKVEFARAARLSPSTIELISFTVPRLRAEFFQDDLFPPALNTWMPSMSSSEWIAGLNKPLEKVDLKPSDMMPLSEAPVKPEAKPVETPFNIVFDGEVTMESSLAFMLNSKEKEEKLVQSMMSRCELQESDLPQEEFEGVDPSEWDDA